MSKQNVLQASAADWAIDTAKCLNDVELAGALMENGKQNGGELSTADIVFSLRNFLKMKLMSLR